MRANLNISRNRVLISTGNMVTLQNMGPVRGGRKAKNCEGCCQPIRHEHREKDSETDT